MSSKCHPILDDALSHKTPMPGTLLLYYSIHSLKKSRKEMASLCKNGQEYKDIIVSLYSKILKFFFKYNHQPTSKRIHQTCDVFMSQFTSVCFFSTFFHSSFTTFFNDCVGFLFVLFSSLLIFTNLKKNSVLLLPYTPHLKDASA